MIAAEAGREPRCATTPSADVAAPEAASTPIGSEVAALIRRSADANAALMRGDIETYRALVSLADDFTLMSPFGGGPTQGRDITDDRWSGSRDDVFTVPSAKPYPIRALAQSR
jgi:hypothetical protein